MVTHAEFEARYQEQRRAAERAFQERGGAPPVRSQVNGPPADWKRWGALLDGVPVGSCWAFDTEAGWVEVWVLWREATERGRKKYGPSVASRSADHERRRLFGLVQAVPLDEWERLKKQRGAREVWDDALEGEPVPGTRLRDRG